jgi:Na+-driven multidrug efflux pump
MEIDYQTPQTSETNWPWLLAIISCCVVEVVACALAVYWPHQILWLPVVAPFVIMALAFVWRFFERE